ncbi:hypothetical protein Ddye_017636 [Dipteronia dyeriana]|uniref:Reverse transcriptase domain-containing protein n=1 Tax=Dipteronia dyeriana TaxID=168575 RepID=A0AAD9X1C0_9ROSI|nr:hypothetical protein Ddye_017636 [Dipteronia dyeriana]
MDCISSVSYSFILNGKVRGFIKPTRGLRQGDPLYLYIFILCAEGFSSLISKSERYGDYNGLRCSRLGPKITHLFFANDSLLFTRASMKECINIKGLIKIYVEASGQIINFPKSAACFSKQISTSDRNLLAGFLEMKIVDHHDKYLGLPCVTSRSKGALFNSVKERVWKKLQSWSSRFFLRWWSGDTSKGCYPDNSSLHYEFI